MRRGGGRLLKQLALVVMGPGVRRDDIERPSGGRRVERLRRQRLDHVFVIQLFIQR